VAERKLIRDVGVGLIGAILGVGGTLVGAYITADSTDKQTVVLERQAKAAEEQAEASKEQAKKMESEATSCNTEVAHYVQAIGRAPTSFHADISRLVEAATAPSMTLNERVAAARSIVAARDSYRKVLDGMRPYLDHEIDALADEANKKSPDEGKLKMALDVLKGSWESKAAPLEIASRALLLKHGIPLLPTKTK
jgi:chromosome segregation ATPase